MRMIVFLVALLALLGTAAPVGAQSSSPYAYTVDDPHAGLSTPDGPLNLDTPQALMETFLDAAQRGDWDRAAHTLDLSYLPPAEQAEQGPRLAQQLYQVVHRSTVIDWNALPDRPDGLDAMSSSKDPMAGAARRNIVLTRMELANRTVSIRIARLAPAGGEPLWVFSRQTVENVPMLHRIYGPTQFEKALPAGLRAQAFWTLAWWEVIALPLVLLLALAAAVLTHVAIRRFRRRSGSHRISAILKAVRIPSALFAFVGTFTLIRSIAFTFSGAVNAVLDPLQTALIVIAIAAILLSIMEAALDMVSDRQIDEDVTDPDAEHERNVYTTLSATRRIIIVMLILGGIGFILIETQISSTLGFSLVASAGAIGLVIAFAARAVLADIMASLQIAFAKTARIGDAVLFNDQWCHVEHIGFTHVQLKTWDGRRIMAPVNEFVSSSFENWTAEDPSILKPVLLHLDHRADVGRLREAFEDFVQADDDVIEKDEAQVQVVDHDAQSMVVRFVIRASDPSSGWDAQCRLREHMLDAAARMDAAASDAPAPSYLPRQREEQLVG